ncbi:allophanate hydrolase, partial [Acinetobacter baumannii]
DGALASLADRLHRDQAPTIGATGHSLTGPALDAPPAAPAPGAVRLAVVGAHLSGQPLNHQLTDRQARLVATTRTAAGYRLFAL